MNIKKISIKNFRVFKEKTTFQLRPFTILTGPNNSGKSSFTKLLLLLKEGVSKFNFTSGNHNLEDFNSILNWESNSEELELIIEIDETSKIKYKYFIDGLIESVQYFESNELVYSLSRSQVISFDNEKETCKLSKSSNAINNVDEDLNLYVSQIINLKFFISRNVILNDKYKSLTKQREQEIANSGLLYEVFINNENVTLNYKEELNKIQRGIFSSFYEFMFTDDVYTDFFLIMDRMRKSFLRALDKKVKEQVVQKLKINIDKDSLEISKSTLYDMMFVDYGQSIINNSIFHDFKGRLFDSIFGIVNQERIFKKIYYLSPSRGGQKRVMMNQSESDIDSILVDFSKRKIFHKDFIKVCFSILGIEGELEVNRYENTISTLYLKQNDKKVSLADIGFGYSQIIPIILKIHNLIPQDKIKRKTFDLGTLILEEPEANLHPNLQSKLAELLAYIQSVFNIKFIIETHSEYFIRKLQYLTAKNELKTEDSVIYYFNDDKYVSKTEPKVKEIFINEEGGLTDSFGPGFFDEATKLQFDLIRLQKQQFN